MSYNERGRRTRYDNIAQGSALTTKENTILGNTVSVHEIHGGGRRTSTSNEEQFYTNVQAGCSVSETEGPENEPAAADMMTGENVETTNNEGVTS